MKIKTILLLITLLIIALSFINSPPDKWEKHTVLPAGYKINDLLFFNRNEGLLFGSYRSEELRFNGGFRKNMIEQKAIILKTNDGGLNWNKVYKDIGEITKSSAVNDIVYALKRSYHDINDDTQIGEKSHLLKSSDRGKTWIKIKTFKDFICGIYFYNPLNGIAWGVYPNDIKCYAIITYDGGQSWQPVKFSTKPEILSFLPVLYDNEVFIYYSSNKIIKKDLNNGTETTEQLPLNFEPSLLALDQDLNIWIIGKIDHNIRLFRKPNEGEFKNIPTPFDQKAFSLEDLFVFKDTISVFLMEIKESQFLPTIHMYRSENSGKTWVKEKLPISSKAKPIAFYGKDYIWVIGPGGQIQIRKP